MNNKNKRVVLIELLFLLVLIILSVIVPVMQYKYFGKPIIWLIVLLIAFSLAKVFFFFGTFKNTKNRIDDEDLLATMSKYISGGRIKFLLDDDLTLTYFDQHFLGFTGYSKEEIKSIFANKYIDMIDERYRENVLDILKNQSIDKSKSQIYYKLICKGGEKKGVINMYQGIEGKNTMQNFLLEPSAFTYIKSKQDIEAERYRIVAEQSESIIFDYNIIEGKIALNSFFEKKFGYEMQGNIFDVIFQNQIIHEEDIDKFMSLPVCNNEYNELEVRIRQSNGKYIWCKIRVTTLFDEKHLPIRLSIYFDIRFETLDQLKALNPTVFNSMENLNAYQNLVFSVAAINVKLEQNI